MVSRSARCEAIVRAAAVVGDMKRLSGMLGVPLQQLELWLEGKATPPPHVFLAAVDIIEDYAEQASRHAINRAAFNA